MQLQSSILVGIGGGSGSGKTRLSRLLASRLAPTNCIVLEQDAYYRDLSQIPMDERERVHFDRPEAVDFDLLIKDTRSLLAGESIDLPVYDFSRHVRKETTRSLNPAEVIILEGILIFVPEELRKLMDLRLFVHAPENVRSRRRLQRDVKERGRNADFICRQIEESVLPAHREFVEPSRKYADMIIPGEGKTSDVIIEVVKNIQEILIKRRMG